MKVEIYFTYDTASANGEPHCLKWRRGWRFSFLLTVRGSETDTCQDTCLYLDMVMVRT